MLQGERFRLSVPAHCQLIDLKLSKVEWNQHRICLYANTLAYLTAIIALSNWIVKYVFEADVLGYSSRYLLAFSDVQYHRDVMSSADD